jgi:hypothetical protein
MLLIAKAALGVTATLAVGAAYTFHEGVIRVDVDENKIGGSHVHFWVPATLVGVGMRVAPRHALKQAAEEAREILPAVRLGAKELRNYPDAVLVEVTNAEEHVRVATEGGKLRVDVNGDDGVVHVMVPLETIQDVTDQMEELNGGV